MHTPAGIRPLLAERGASAVALVGEALSRVRDPGCSISIPCHEPGEAPVGLMLIGARTADRKLLAIGLTVGVLVSQRFAALHS